MKRWGLFLVIFLVGLGVLWWIDRGHKREPHPPDPGVAQGGPAGQGPLTPVMLPPTKPGSGGTDDPVKGSGGFDGPFLMSTFDPDTGELEYRVTADNAKSVGDGVYLFDKLVGRFFVPGTDRVRMEVKADQARGRLTPVPELSFDRDYPVELDGVVATFFESSPFAPLTVRVPHATGTFAAESFSSTDRVDIHGTGLAANGTGLSFDGKLKELRLERDTLAELTIEDGTPAKLSAVGGLAFTSLEKFGEGANRVVAREAARLTFGGESPLVVDADSIELDAQVARAPATRVTPTRVAAHGSVRIAPVDANFFGDDADLELGANGRPQQARLRGSPRVELLLRGVDLASVPGAVAREAADLEVKMIGAGPLDVRLEGDAHFDFRGPATLLLPALDLSLAAQEKLSGTRRGASEFARLDATGAVEAQWGASKLTSDALTIERKLTEDGQLAASLTSPGPTRAQGPLEDGGSFDLKAKGGLEFVRLAKSFQVPIAREVDLDVIGPTRFYVKAAEVRDLDLLTRSFVAVGDVLFDSEKGRGRGERLIGRGKDSAELIGAPSAPAHVDLEQGWLEAREINFDVDRLRAEGEARALIGLESARYDLSSRWISLLRTAQGAGEELLLQSGGDVVARVEEQKNQLELSAQSLEARAYSPGKQLKELKSQGLVADGQVAFRASGEQELSGEGERLVIEADRSGTLVPSAGQRVQLRGRLPKNELSFVMGAGTVSFSPDSLYAQDPVIELEGLDVPLGRARAAGDLPLRAIAGSMSADRTSILFTDGVYLGQAGAQETVWSLDAEKLVLTGSHDPNPADNSPRFMVSSVLAWGGFQAQFAEQIFARGTSLQLDRDRDRLSIRGEPAEFDYDEMRLRTEWLEFEFSTGFWRSSKGSVLPLDERNGAYELSFESMEPIYGVDSRVEVIRELRLKDAKKQREVRASWAVFWLDEQRLKNLAAKLVPNSGVALIEIPTTAERAKAPHNEFLKYPLPPKVLEWVKEFYLDGNIEVLDRGERSVRADGVYLNLVDGHGWLRDVEVTRELPLRAAAHQVKLHADWMRYAPDGSVRAENAVATSCLFDEPHYEFTLGDLRMKRRLSAKAREAIAAGRSEGADETDGYEVKSRKNSLRFGGGPNFPLGPLSFVMNENLEIDEESLSFSGIPLLAIGSSSRYGLFIGASIALPLGWMSRRFNDVLGKGSQPIKEGSVGHVKYSNSRGLLLGVTNRVSQQGVFKLKTDLFATYDTGTDRGLVRAPKDERETLRAWLHLEGRRLLGEREWIDINLTAQSDPGFQSEYFEREFLRWEERETYVHWRKARGLDYSRATLEARLDEHRTEVVDAPSLGYTRGRAGVVRWWGRELVYSSDTSVAHLLRLEGDLRLDANGNRITQDPFGAVIVDGFGEEEVLRFDTRQRWELPMPLDLLDARLVPFVEARGTAWDRGGDSATEATRLGLLAGAEASTTFWRMYGDGDLHSLTPTLGFRGALDVEESGPTPAQFDGVEDPIDGNFTDLGLRSRWVKPREIGRAGTEERFLDIELRQTYAEDLSAGREEGWQPLRVSAQWLSQMGKIPFGVTHEGRHDIGKGETVYSGSAFGVRPVKDVEIEVGFHDARDLAGAALYSAWRLEARYQFSPKWQFEGRETISTLSDSQLSSGLLLRRVGHDFIIEIEYSFTAGEGGSSVGFKLIPMLAYRERKLGLLSRWQSQGN